MSILTPEVIVILILDIVFVIFGTISFVLSVKISLKWDTNSLTSAQYKLEKQSFLVATIIKYILLIKLPLFLFFIFTMDKLSFVIPGAMCAAGVVNATVYGFYLMIIKIANLYLFGIWLILHIFDTKKEDYPYTKIKFTLFSLIFIFLLIETILEFLMFYNIDPSKIVSCCGTLFSAAKTSYVSSLLLLPQWFVLSLFYGSYLAGVLSFKFLQKFSYLTPISNLLFLAASLLSLISFFSTYIYELPTHHCPFCLLQSDYYFVGYFLYAALFIGTFSGIAVAVVAKADKENIQIFKKISLIFNTIYLFLVTSYPIAYYIKNGVWL